MSTTTNLLSSSVAKLWQSVNYATRNFHMLMRPIVCGGTITQGNGLPADTSNAANTMGQISPQSPVQRLLTPVSALLTQVAGFKVKGRLKRRCKDCYIVVREERAYVICPTHPRHKQMAMKQRDYKSWILTHATQSKVRGY